MGKYGLSKKDIKSAGGLSVMSPDELRNAHEACKEELTRLNARGDLKDTNTFYAFGVVEASIRNLETAITMK
jgi:hypothetical protein